MKHPDFRMSVSLCCATLTSWFILVYVLLWERDPHEHFFYKKIKISNLILSFIQDKYELQKYGYYEYIPNEIIPIPNSCIWSFTIFASWDRLGSLKDVCKAFFKLDSLLAVSLLVTAMWYVRICRKNITLKSWNYVSNLIMAYW